LDGNSDTSIAQDGQQHQDDHSQPKSVSLEITEAAVQAVIESAKRREKEEEEVSAARSKSIKEDSGRDVNADADEHEHENSHEDDSSQESSESTHQMILAELLTQVWPELFALRILTDSMSRSLWLRLHLHDYDSMCMPCTYYIVSYWVKTPA
jgi:hypothetical protein